MSGYQEKNVEEGSKNKYLNTVIECLTESKLSPRAVHPSENTQLPNLYGQANQLLSDFDTSINRCKKYNEAKINRKYQIIIRDLEAEIRKLTQKLKLQQQARSPTKKHISDILDKLVAYKDENQQLSKELSEARQKIAQLEQKTQSQGNALLKLQGQTKPNVERLPSIPNGGLSDTVKIYLKEKQSIRAKNSSPPSSLEKFLNLYRSKMWNWNVGNLLQELDKWAEGVKERPEVDMWRIRSGIARKFSELMDQPSALLMPSITASKTQKQPLSPMYSQPPRRKRLSAFDFKAEKSRTKRLLESSLN